MSTRTLTLRWLSVVALVALTLSAAMLAAQPSMNTAVVAEEGPVLAPIAPATNEPASATSETATPAAGSESKIQNPKSEIEAGPILPPLEAEPNNEGLRFNFRGVPLDAVLDYMSRAAGFIIVREATVSGTVDVLSHQPVNKDESVLLLNTILHQKGLAAIRSDRTLTIVKREDAITRDLPIRMGSDPSQIPKNDEMVTQIIPVRYTDVNQLMQNLQPMLPEYATISANQSSRALILTDTQTNIHRVAQIVKALDTSSPQVSNVKIFKIKQAEATEIAVIINQIFSGQQGSSSRQGGRTSNDPRQQIMEMMSRMRGGGPGGDFGGRGGFGGRGR